MGDAPLAQLKLQALLDEVRVDYDKLQPQVDATIEAIKNVVSQIPEAEIPTALAKAYLKDLGVPRSKSLLTFRTPESYTVIGSFSTQTMTKPDLVVDLSIRIPKSCFHEKDFLNHRFHAKRCLYLAIMHKYLRSSSTFQSVEWSFLHQDSRKPALIVKPVAGDFIICLLPSISDDVFSSSKLTFSRNNVRDAKTNEGVAKPTPHYTCTILEDMCVEARNELVKCQLESGCLREAVILLKVWLRQRNFSNYSDSFNGFLISLLVLHLSSTAGGQRLTKHMTSLQIFRITMEMIGTCDILAKGIKLQLDDNQKSSSTKVEHTLWDVSFFDTVVSLNLAFRITKSAAEEVKVAASQTLASMKVSTEDCGFHECFMTTVDVASKFDYILRLKVSNPTPPLLLDEEAWRVTEKKVETVVSRSLQDRATLVRVIRRSLSSGWNPKKALSDFCGGNILVGITLGAFETAFRMVDVGPSADNKEEASKFRSFWGEKSELRRFKDGSITETLAWECLPWERHLIICHILEYILGRHLSVPPSHVNVVSGQLDFALLYKGEDPVKAMPKILQAFETLSKRLRSLSGIPLKVSSVQPLSAAFRHTSVFPPQPLTAKQQHSCAYVEPLEVMIQLEGSGRWPNDAVAVHKTKAAFSLKIAECMQRQFGVQSVVSEDAVDLLMDGFAFRICIYYQKDVKPLDPRQDLMLCSTHSSMLYGLHGLYFGFAPTVRLAKRWVSSHLFSGVIADEAVELLVAYLFVRPYPYAPPSTRITGFLRFLRLLATFDWSMCPLIVDINGDLSAKERENILAEFERVRKEDGPYGGGIFLATSYDRESMTWTRSRPSKLELKRLVAYAKSSAALLSRNMTGEDDRWQSIFRTPLERYERVIILERKMLPYPGRVIFPTHLDSPGCWQSKERATIRNEEKSLIIGLNPVVEYVKELKKSEFGELYEIWYDGIGGDVLGLSVKKEVRKKRKRNEEEEEEMTSEIAAIGEGIVHSIHNNFGNIPHLL